MTIMLKHHYHYYYYYYYMGMAAVQGGLRHT